MAIIDKKETHLLVEQILKKRQIQIQEIKDKTVNKINECLQSLLDEGQFIENNFAISFSTRYAEEKEVVIKIIQELLPNTPISKYNTYICAEINWDTIMHEVKIN